MRDSLAASNRGPTVRTAIVLCVAIRLALIFLSIGSNDAKNIFDFGGLVSQVGFFELYRWSDAMNHPPIPVIGWSLLYRLTGEHVYPFSILLKLPPLITDAFATALIARIVRERAGIAAGARAALLFALNPVSILITAYHGNTDSIVAFFVLLTWFYADRGRWFAAGLAMSAAINTKISPSFTVFVLLACVPNRDALGRVLAALAIGAVPFALMRIFVGPLFFAHVFGYAPWEFSWVATIGWEGRRLPAIGPAMMWFAESHRATLRQATLLIALVCAALRWDLPSRYSPLTIAALTWSAFTFWTGGVYQYCVWPVPLLAAVRPRLAMWYGVGAGVYLVWAYVAVLQADRPVLHYFPLWSKFQIFDDQTWQWALPLPLMALAALIVSLLRKPAQAPGLK